MTTDNAYHYVFSIRCGSKIPLSNIKKICKDIILRLQTENFEMTKIEILNNDVYIRFKSHVDFDIDKITSIAKSIISNTI